MVNLKQADMIMYAMLVYGSLMPKGQPFTLGELAQTIRSTYQLAGARGVAILQILEANGHRVASLI